MSKFAVIKTDTLPAVPWKNGGGITREIAQAPGPKGFAWRLSIADVAAEGPFSNFAGMARILTVIDGNGLRLCDPDHCHDVACCTPFHFSGETPIRSILSGGEIRDFNVIYDPEIMSAKVQIHTGPEHIEITPTSQQVHGLFGIHGDFDLSGRSAKKGDFVLVKEQSVSIGLPTGSKVLIVQLAQGDTPISCEHR